MGTEKLSPGDIVQLKSGGPAMTVNRIVEANMGGGVKAVFCTYYDELTRKFLHIDFYDYALMKLEESNLSLQERLVLLEKELADKDLIIGLLRQKGE
ncbi:YodC family protein [Pontibacter sp. SGAir0037]|uniref:YodC family protein n=1 Tax=Pontibacter sp. SGAir0037 TaxID=2571030 RepID=UPI0010CD0371|nr:DUF2158 domain-containing protein [Pontibacter sp. SGAir0037]QCR21330.1 hypothetical protein C1N53_02530 [Pontibacter sp. SGAir0037]